MGRKKISNRPELYLKENSHVLEVNLVEGLEFEDLKDSMIEALLEDDLDSFKGGIGLLIDKVGYRELVNETGLSKSTLYRMSEPDSNPTLLNITKVLSFINSRVENQVA